MRNFTFGFEEAVKEIRKTGIVFLRNFLCCQTCGCAEIDSRYTDKKGSIPLRKARIKIGYAFWHKQDNDSLLADGKENGVGVYLAYGSFHVGDSRLAPKKKEDRIASSRIAGHLVSIFSKWGVRVEWNGSENERVKVFPYTGIDAPVKEEAKAL
jgi:hypothetical protein